MFDLEQQIKDKFHQMNEEGEISGFVDKYLRSTIESTIKNAVENCFRYSSESKKVLEEAVRKAVSFDFDDHSIPTFRETILQVVKAEIESKIQTLGIEKAKEAVADLLEESIPEEITFEKLIEEFIEEEFDEEERHDGGEISLDIDDHGNLVFIRFDKESGKERYQCEHALTLHEDGRIHSYEFGGRNNPPFSFGRTYGFQRKLFKMYALGTKVTGAKDCDVHDLKSFCEGY